MNNDDDFARKITAYLDAGTAQMKPGTAYKLQQARQQALARMAGPVPVAQSRLAHAFASPGTSSEGKASLWKSARLWLGIAAIVLASFAWQQWQAYQQTRELEELDAQLLSSDLPIDAYLDRGFQNWLTRREP
jgi:hypothetical protein